jgi:uncharacterized protein GlcG (DUF336 family)
MPGITLQQANAIAEVVLKKGRETDCAPLTVAVLDAGGHLVVLKREDGSGILRPEIATAKAWGALGMGYGSREIADRARTGATFVSALTGIAQGRLVPAAGGVLIRDSSGEVIGAAGVSGDTSENDETCALAGIEAAGLKAQAGG